ncbi:MAG: hypothetical protein JF588_20545 [Caulobacterales bacterium]|nr:hypothetical protein [Caulobacterales bacterium]
MAQPDKTAGRGPIAAIVDFDEALLDACEPQARAELLMEAQLLAGVFAPGAGAEALLRMADQLSAGERDAEMDRAHARRLAAALKRLAKGI